MGLAEELGNSLTGVFPVVSNIAQVVMYTLVFGFFAVLLLYFLKFKYPLYLIKETSGGGKRFVKDRGWLNKKKNEFKALKNKDVMFPYPLSEHEYIEGRKSSYIAVVRNQSASFLDISENPHFVPADYDMREKLTNEFKNSWSILEPKQNFWDKFGAQVLWVGSMGIFLIVIILILKRMDAIISLGHVAAQSQIAANKQVITSLPLLLWGVTKKWGKKQYY